MEKDASARLGSQFCTLGDIMDQPFFKTIDWKALEKRQIEPPFKPEVVSINKKIIKKKLIQMFTFPAPPPRHSVF